jgi:hypothetical protein
VSKRRADILVIVEGGKTDIRLMERLLMLYGIDSKHQIVSYNTNIYALYNAVFKEVDDPYSIDLLLHLRSREPDTTKKLLLSQSYAEILLVFDFDPHDPEYSDEKIREMMAVFSESTEMGKLYINYPMVEAFYHVKDIPDGNYNSYTVSMMELETNGYKGRVGRESCTNHYKSFPENLMDSNVLIRQNIAKAWHVLGADEHEENIPPDSSPILEVQLVKMKREQEIAVLCTCVFYISDYNPGLLIEQNLEN